MNLKERVLAPTPSFFRKLRNAGLVIAATGGVLLGAPVVLPVVVINLAGYLVLAGGIIGVLSQATVGDDVRKTEELKSEKGMTDVGTQKAKSAGSVCKPILRAAKRTAKASTGKDVC